MEFLRRVLNFCTGRWYAVYTSGHGSGFVRDRELRTRRRALAEADSWVGDACTIGGDAMVKNIFTDKIVYPTRLRGYKFNSVVRG